MGRILSQTLFIVCLCFVAACGETTPEATSAPEQRPTQSSANFDRGTAAQIIGRVSWTGDIPVVPPFETRPCPIAMDGLRDRIVRPNPNAPDIDRQSRAVRNAIVYLRNVVPANSRPWDLPPMRVEFADRMLHIRQGACNSNVGFVQRGTKVDFESRDSWFHCLHARGAAFFAIPFPDAHQPASKQLTENGIVELSSGAGYYWMRGYLFVSEHPYFARTDNDGRFELRDVPPGAYEMKCWMPNWLELKRERDPDTALVSRITFADALQSTRLVALHSNETATVDFSMQIDGARRP